MFTSGFGLKLLMGSGWKVSITSRLQFWLMSLKVTLWVKDLCRILVNSHFFMNEKKKGHVNVFPDSVAKDVEPQTHFIAISGGIKWQAEDGGILATVSITHSLTELRYFPHHSAIIIAIFNEKSLKFLFSSSPCFAFTVFFSFNTVLLRNMIVSSFFLRSHSVICYVDS